MPLPDCFNKRPVVLSEAALLRETMVHALNLLAPQLVTMRQRF